MNVSENSFDPKTTSECVELLSKYDLLPTKWKRTYKIKFGEEEIRVFKNEDGEFKTIVTGGYKTTRIFNDLNILELIPLIKEISRVSKFYYTHDYGAVFLNPYTKDLYISAGDGGYIYSTKSKSYLQKKMDEEDLDMDDDNGFIDFDAHESLSELNSVEWEAESDPLELEFIEICQINTLE